MLSVSRSQSLAHPMSVEVAEAADRELEVWEARQRREGPRVPGNPALDKLYGMLATVEGASQTSEPSQTSEEVLNVTMVDGVPYITMEPKKAAKRPIAAPPLPPPSTTSDGTQMSVLRQNDFDDDDLSSSASHTRLMRLDSRTEEVWARFRFVSGVESVSLQ